MVSYWAISATERISTLEAPQANVEWLNIRRKSLQSAQIDKEQEITPKLIFKGYAYKSGAQSVRVMWNQLSASTCSYSKNSLAKQQEQRVSFPDTDEQSVLLFLASHFRNSAQETSALPSNFYTSANFSSWMT